MFVFAYGSLLDPASLTRTLPSVDLDTCVPARLQGYTRTFSVAFRNDGTHRDKAYIDEDRTRPPVVLFCDIEPAPSRSVNGVCVPVDDASFALLRARELRYDVIDVTSATSPWVGDELRARVQTFVGRDIHRAPADIASGVVADHYLASVQAGAAHWDAVAPGFLDEFRASTTLPEPSLVRALTRIDAPR